MADPSGLIHLQLASPAYAEARAGVLIAHVAHLCSALMLHGLTLQVFAHRAQKHQIAFLSSSLHILSPAGLFLSAPYSEAVFSFWQFAGYLLYARSCSTTRSETLWLDVQLVLAGLCIGLATTARSNGLLSGILFAVEGAIAGAALVGKRNLIDLRRGMAAMLGGLLVAFGSAFPQMIAYYQFCEVDQKKQVRPWCRAWIPSIYAWVQSNYW